MSDAPPPGWAPTHRTASDGIATWAQPDPAAPNQPLAGDLEVVVVERAQHGWTKIRCTNGWEAWVDERFLVPLDAGSPAATALPLAMASPLAAPTSPATAPAAAAPLVTTSGGGPSGPANTGGSSKAWLLVAAIVVLALIGAGALLLTRRSDSGQTAAGAGPSGGGASTSTTAKPAPVEGVPELRVPDGWHRSDDGTRVAKDEADLTSDKPTGPRARLMTEQPPADVELYEDALNNAVVDEVSAPETTMVDGRDAVTITMQQSPDGPPTFTTRYVTVTYEAGHAALFVLEAPTELWDSAEAELATIPSLR